MDEIPLAGRYELVRPIGEGGAAIVYEALDLKMRRRVAVKRVRPAYARVPEVIQRLEREGRIGAAITHPHVCAVTDMDRSPDGTPFLVLELLRGEPLSTRLTRDRRLAFEEALRVGMQMLAGLADVHHFGIVHRDVKPSNVFLVQSGVHSEPLVKLIDFGTAQVPGMPGLDGAAITAKGVVVGTAEYMSPEQVRGVREFDARTDVYSAGVVLYEMITGARPFGVLPPREVLEAVAFKQAPRISVVEPRVPPGIADAIDVALANDRDRRHADAATFLDALRARAAPLATGVTSVVANPGDWDLATLRSAPATDSIDVVIEHDRGTPPITDAVPTKPRGRSGG